MKFRMYGLVSPIIPLFLAAFKRPRVPIYPILIFSATLLPFRSSINRGIFFSIERAIDLSRKKNCENVAIQEHVKATDLARKLSE